MSSTSLNIGNFVTLKLKPENYPFWREQVLALAESQELTEFLIGESQPLPVVLPTTEGSNPLPNPEYKKWKIANWLLRGWIIGTLAEEALGQAISLDISTQVWVALKVAYAQASQERHF